MRKALKLKLEDFLYFHIKNHSQSLFNVKFVFAFNSVNFKWKKHVWSFI